MSDSPSGEQKFASQGLNSEKRFQWYITEMNQAPTSCLVKLQAELLSSGQTEYVQGVVSRLVLRCQGTIRGSKESSFRKMCSCDGVAAEKYVACRPCRTPTPPVINPFLIRLVLSRMLPTCCKALAAKFLKFLSGPSLLVRLEVVRMSLYCSYVQWRLEVVFMMTNFVSCCSCAISQVVQKVCR